MDLTPFAAPTNSYRTLLPSHRYLVLPFYKWTLKSYFAPIIQARVDGGSVLMDEREVLLLLLQLCNALVHLQRNHVVHRDLKVGWLVCCSG